MSHTNDWMAQRNSMCQFMSIYSRFFFFFFVKLFTALILSILIRKFFFLLQQNRYLYLVQVSQWKKNLIKQLINHNHHGDYHVGQHTPFSFLNRLQVNCSPHEIFNYAKTSRNCCKFSLKKHHIHSHKRMQQYEIEQRNIFVGLVFSSSIPCVFFFLLLIRSLSVPII